MLIQIWRANRIATINAIDLFELSAKTGSVMTPVRFILNNQKPASHSAWRARTGLAPASRNLKFVSSPGSSAIAV
jgi:hypothetical protein